MDLLKKIEATLTDALGNNRNARNAAARVSLLLIEEGVINLSPAQPKNYRVFLERVNDNQKIDCLKRIRETMGNGLREAKDMLDGLLDGAPPLLVFETPNEFEADRIKAHFRAGGHTATIYPV